MSIGSDVNIYEVQDLFRTLHRPGSGKEPININTETVPTQKEPKKYWERGRGGGKREMGSIAHQSNHREK